MNARLVAVSFGGALLAGCVLVPTAPMVTALPGSTKGFDQFRADDDYCRGYAQSIVVGPSQAASNTAAANAAVGTALGAAAGAIIGSASGNAGSGAAIGAGTGLLFGSAAGANTMGYSYYALQRQYDAAYVQCMYARGNQVPLRVYGGSMGGYSSPRYSARPSAGSPPAGYPPPERAPDSIPPPNAPPPRY
jgi:hypothetical protein